MSAEGLTGDLAAFVADAEPGAVDAETRAAARRAILDTVGVILAARGDSTMTTLARARAGYERVLAGDAPAPLTVSEFALGAGTAAHALDFDDVTDTLKGHPSVALVPALLAAAQGRAVSGAELLEAYALGYQVAVAVADGLDVKGHYKQGWHTTISIGIFGAAAAAARLLKLDSAATARAFGIAATAASGSRQNFGTMTKPLHAGLAAMLGLRAAHLAGAGFTADPGELEAPLGYYARLGQDLDADAVRATLTERWSLRQRGLNVKRYPSCYNTHRSADNILDLRADGLRAADVESVHIAIEPRGLGPLIHHRPTTGLQGKFSMEYVVAAALHDGELTLATFTDDRVQRPEVRALLPLVRAEEVATPPVGEPTFRHAYSVLTVRRTDGTEHVVRTDEPKGGARRPLTDEELHEKFAGCLSYAGYSGDEIAAVAGRIDGLDETADIAGTGLAQAVAEVLDARSKENAG
ncbi:MmgE/PrpD family protein [Naumannella cuiyingiana]|uniref:2-methylcitrate dehydratase PrpD n=1 Tax=Naumannella cuiyingiana TaxID=1347891 RepID=A0A7Z0IJQ6_9ACTN|nr:2-methylcitrate dehydratase PrpD [Naumannella cuiyingiana]